MASLGPLLRDEGAWGAVEGSPCANVGAEGRPNKQFQTFWEPSVQVLAQVVFARKFGFREGALRRRHMEPEVRPG